MSGKNRFSWADITPSEIEMLYDAMKCVLKQFEIPEYYYSIGMPADDCVCLEYKEGKWIVYENSRGESIHSRSFDNAYEAGCSLFGSVAIGEIKVNLMKNHLRYEIAKLDIQYIYEGTSDTSGSKENDKSKLERLILRSEQKVIKLEEMLRIGGFIKDRKETAEVREIKELYNAVEDVLKQFEIPEYYYSIGMPADDCVCLEFKEGKWIVYENSRGESIHCRSFDNAYEAGYSLFRSVAIGEAKVSSMRLIFESRISDCKRISQLQEEITEVLELAAEFDEIHTSLKINEEKATRNWDKRPFGSLRGPKARIGEMIEGTIVEVVQPKDRRPKTPRSKKKEDGIHVFVGEVLNPNKKGNRPVVGYVVTEEGSKIEIQVPTSFQAKELEDNKQEKEESKKKSTATKKTIIGKKKN